MTILRKRGVVRNFLIETKACEPTPLDAVKEAGIEDNTIFILSSDNAGGGTIPQTGPGSNGPWRGDFFNTPFEGSMQYDLSSDPDEDSNLWYTDLTQGWIFAPNFRNIIEYERSLKEYPNIKVGEDFKGYNK